MPIRERPHLLPLSGPTASPTPTLEPLAPTHEEPAGAQPQSWRPLQPRAHPVEQTDGRRIDGLRPPIVRPPRHDSKTIDDE
jgi:hypothetical protein